MARQKDEHESWSLYSFDGCKLDLARGVLNNADGDIYLRPKSFAVLCHLVQHHGVLVSREDLHEAVWQNTQVGDDSIAQCIVEIRRAIGDAGRTMIRTVPRRGFVFESAVVESVIDASRLANSTGGTFRNRSKLLAAVALAAVAIALVFWMNGQDAIVPSMDAEVSELLPNSIAVLAFHDMSESQDQQYFGDGIAEEILTQLSRFPGLNVIARTSSFSERMGDQDIAAIAERLRAQFVLEGSIRRSGDRIRITAQLIESASSTRVWSKSYDLEFTADSVIDLQNDVARSVAIAVGAETLSPGITRRRSSLTESTEALDHHLKGLYFLRKVEVDAEDHSDKAIHHFDLAIAADPNWAPPYAGSGRVLHFRASRRPLRENSIDYERSRERLLKAIELDPEYAAAYESLAFVTHMLDLDFAESELLYQKSLALGDQTRWGYAMLLGSMGRVDEAIEQYQLGLLNDPLAMGMKIQLARMLKCANRYEDSIVAYTALLEAKPELTAINIVIADLYLQLEETNKAEDLLARYPEFPSETNLIGPIYARLGMKANAEAALDAMESDEEWLAESFVRTALLLDQKDRALDYLVRAAHAEPRSLLPIQCHPDVVALADEPRYQQALDFVGFPPMYRRVTISNRGVAPAQ